MVKKSAKETKVNFEAKVTRVKQWDDGRISFDLLVNGVTIHNMRYLEYTTKEGKEGSMLQFPSYQSKEKWYTHCWFPISKELQSDIEGQIAELIKE